MMKTSKYCILALGILISACSYGDVNPEKGNNMIDLTRKKSWCIGRYAFDMPAEAIFYEQFDQYGSFDIKTVSSKALRADFDREVAKIVKKYTSGYSEIVNESAVVQEKNGSISKIIWAYTDKSISKLVNVRAMVLDKGTLFAIEGSYSPKYESQSKEAIDHLVKNLHWRQDNVIPNEKGFCIKNGFIADDGSKYRYSTQSLILDFPQHPSVDLTFESESVNEDDGGLIKRTEKNLKDEGALFKVLSSIHTIRKGAKKVNQFEGEEWVVGVPMKGRNGIESSWAYSGVAKNNLYPSIQLDFTNGRDSTTKSTSISNKEAEYLNSEILKSLRYF